MSKYVTKFMGQGTKSDRLLVLGATVALSLLGVGAAIVAVKFFVAQAGKALTRREIIGLSMLSIVTLTLVIVFAYGGIGGY